MEVWFMVSRLVDETKIELRSVKTKKRIAKGKAKDFRNCVEMVKDWDFSGSFSGKPHIIYI